MAILQRDFVKVENDFTVIPNEILRNKEMKSSTKNILLTMFSLPPNWDFSIAGISKCVYEGRETVQKAIVELEKIGYITRNRERKEDGTFGAMIYTIHRFPVSKDKNTYKKNFSSNQDVKNQQQEKPAQDTEAQLRINNKLNINISRTDKYAFKDKKQSLKGNIYASVPEEQEVRASEKQSRYISKDYTEEQFIEHIRQPICDYMTKEYGDMASDELSSELINIIISFHREYGKHFENRHRVLSDKAYENIVDRYMNPPAEMINDYSIETYETMMERYFEVNYNQRGNYKGDITLGLSHFMSDNVRNNLYCQTCK